MRIADKIKQFDNMIPANVKQFEELFKIKVNKLYDKNALVEILEPCQGNMRLVDINGNIETIDIDPRIDGRSQVDAFDGGRKMYKYSAFDNKGNLLAEDYTLENISLKVGISKETALNILKRKNEIIENTGGRKRKNIMIKRKLLTTKEERSKVVKKRVLYEYVVYKDKLEIKRFKGGPEAAKFLGVSKATITNYANGNTKNKDGYTIKKVRLD